MANPLFVDKTKELRAFLPYADINYRNHAIRDRMRPKNINKLDVQNVLRNGRVVAIEGLHWDETVNVLGKIEDGRKIEVVISYDTETEQCTIHVITVIEK